LVPVGPRDRWVIYFAYLPDGQLTAAHRFTLNRLRDAGAGVAVVCATPDLTLVPDELRGYSDALYWKDLGGFDFSAYALALRELAVHSPGADVLVLNDSVFGPFVPAEQLWAAMRWDLTGFTASAEIENHVQSYAFFLQNWTVSKLHRLNDIFPCDTAFNNYRDTVYSRESLLASRASRFMSVGALWYADGQRAGDATVYAALPLLDAGFPFLKRSVLLRNSHLYQMGEVLDRLRDLGHPIDDLVPVGLPAFVGPANGRHMGEHV
jgi:lipopolysaccharide biosynthesis protein